MFKVYDQVWTMVRDKPQLYVIYGVAEHMAHMKAGKTEAFYMLVPHQVGATWDNAVRRPPDGVFATKEELLAALAAEPSA